MFRGLSFREAFTRLHGVRSIMPSNIGVMALTATASRPLRQKIEAVLGMRAPFTIIQSPDKPNMRLSVIQVKGCNAFDVPKVFDHILTEIQSKLTLMPRVMIFCKVKSDCWKLYSYFNMSLGRNFCHPPGTSPDVIEARLVDMFFKGTDSDVKRTIIENFTKPSCLRIVICTDAFGMGINCKEVRCIIHYGVPSDKETYVQQIGRGGREGLDSYAIMMHSKKLLENCEPNVLEYVRNKSQCRRDMLFHEFENFDHSAENQGCKCCDICIKQCECSQCITSLSLNFSFIPVFFNQRTIH